MVRAAGIAANATDLFWLGSTLGPNETDLMKVSLSGGTPVALVQNVTAFVFPPANNSGTMLVADATNVFWVDSTGSIVKVGTGGGTPTVVVQAGYNVADVLAIDATNLYWSDVSLNTIFKIGLKGGQPSEIPGVTNNFAACALAADGKNLFWTICVTAAWSPTYARDARATHWLAWTIERDGQGESRGGRQAG